MNIALSSKQERSDLKKAQGARAPHRGEHSVSVALEALLLKRPIEIRRKNGL